MQQGIFSYFKTLMLIYKPCHAAAQNGLLLCSQRIWHFLLITSKVVQSGTSSKSKESTCCPCKDCQYIYNRIPYGIYYISLLLYGHKYCSFQHTIQLAKFDTHGGRAENLVCRLPVNFNIFFLSILSNQHKTRLRLRAPLRSC